MTLVMAAVFLSGCVVNISHLGHTKTPIPWLIQTMCIEGLARALCLYGRLSPVFKVTLKSKRPTRARADNINVTPSLYPPLLGNVLYTNTHNTSNDTEGLHDVIVRLDNRLDKVEENLTKVKEEDSLQANHEFEMRILRLRWRNIAIVLDRLFLSLYFLAIIISLVLLFPRP